MKTIFIFAHPDDESFTSGGTIAKLTKEGIEVKLISATKGEVGERGNPPLANSNKELGKVREKELKQAGKVLGISEIFFLDYIDGTLKEIPQNELEVKISEILHKENPDIIVTFDKNGSSNHPDHIAISKVATKAAISFIKTAKKHVKFYHTAVPKSYLKKYKEKGLEYKAFGEQIGVKDADITTTIDIKDTYETKVMAFKKHMTQQNDWQRFLKRSEMVDIKQEFFELIFENGFV